METKTNDLRFCLAIINNIPSEYHSSDLRNYFSQFIESGGFDCFHFRHRPEVKSTAVSGENDQNMQKKTSTTCCVVRIKNELIDSFVKMYNRKHWISKNEEVMSSICCISRVKEPEQIDGTKPMKTRAEMKQIPPDRENFTHSDLQNLPELHPPDIMPNGNVGTPTRIFMDYIKQCRLPPSIIKKLGLRFPKTRTNKQYGSVPFDYGSNVVEQSNDSESDLEVLTASGLELVSEKIASDIKDNCDNNKEPALNKTSDNTECETVQSGSNTVQADKNQRKKKKGWKDAEARERMKLNIEEKMIGEADGSEEDNDSCEEWERHEAMYDDPSNQERNKERLYEEKIELKWEKGGSGLVFYTDAQHWQAQEGDFDEQTADDWDVDMSGYYEEGAGDKDARDFLAIRQETRRREGIEETDRFTAGIAAKKRKGQKKDLNMDNKIGKFEAHTKGIGRKILEDQGWSEGQGLGSSIRGIPDALDNDGQNPKDRKGFGYHGEKLNRHPGVAERKVIISTVYDNPNHTDPHEPLKRRHEPYHLKYRDEVKFSKSETIQFNDNNKSTS